MSTAINYENLLEHLFYKGLSPRTEALIEGLSKFFTDSYYEAIGGNKSNLNITKSMGNGLVECLNSSQYKVVEVASRVLRDYVNTVYEIPPNCIQNLINALNKTVPSSARQAAMTLGCVGCSKPTQYLRLGIRPIDEVDMELCWRCQGGFLRRGNARQIVPALIDNLNRPTSRDKSREVRRACAIALGEIGYTNPRAVLDALEPLRVCLKERKGREGVIFALGCIGYTRPDLVEDLKERFKACWDRGSPREAWACYNSLRKIGMETSCVLRYAIEGKRSLTETMEIFFERMKKYEGILVDESIDAIKQLAERFPDDSITCLNLKLQQIHQERQGLGHLIQNISIAINGLAEKFSGRMRDTVPILVDHFKTGQFQSYRTLDSSANALKAIFKQHPEFISEGIVEILDKFLEDEKRMSVIFNTKELLEEIEKHMLIP
ncbi:MAG: HEAT repeat domain-containing protein [Asgard group archaeon]